LRPLSMEDNRKKQPGSGDEFDAGQAGEPFQMNQDITERKQAEDRLREYERVIEGLEDMITVVDRDYRYLIANRAFLNHRGMVRDQVIGHYVSEVLDHEIFEKIIKQKLDECFQGKVVKYELTYTYPKLGQRDLLVSYFPIEGPDGVDRVAAVLQDITERKRAEEALRESEQLSRSVLENIDEIIYMVSAGSEDPLRGTVQFVSGRVEQIIGYKPDEFLNDPELWFNLLHPDDVPAVVDSTRKIFQEKQSLTRVYRIRHRHTGQYRWMEDRVVPRLDDAGSVVATFGVARDISERKRAEQKFRGLLESAPDAMVIIDHDSEIVLLNSQTENLFGYSKAELLGQKIEILIPERFRDKHHGHRAGYFEGPKTRPMGAGLELHGVRKDGTELPVEISSSPLEIEEGRLVISAIRDITERRRAEEARREAEQKYRNIFENAGEGIFQSTPQGRFLVANPALARMHGFDSPEDLIRSRGDISRQVYVDPARREEFKRLLEENGIVRGFEHQVFRKDGSKIWISVNARAVRDEGGVIRYYEGTAQDINERKHAEAQSAAFAALARKLSGARTPLDAGRIIAQTAADLFAWDSFDLNLYDADRDLVHPMLNIDTIDGRQIDTVPSISDRKPTARSRRAIDHGPELRLREEPIQFDSDAILFGDKTRPSASIMTVPVRHAARVVGVLSVHSYTPENYDGAALANLEALADHCGEALNRIRAEESLFESEERFRQMADHFEDVIWIADRDITKTLYINPAYERVFGRSCESLYERLDSFVDAVHPDDRDAVCRMLDRQREGDDEPFEYRIVQPDGSVRWILRRSFPIRNNDGEILRMAGIGQDITERKRAEEALRESEERYRDLVENSREFICTHDLDGLILSANRAAVRVLGYDSRDYCGKKKFSDLLVPEVRDQFDEYLTRIRRDGAAGGLVSVQTSSGDRRIWEYHNTLRTEGVATPIVRGMARDITEQRRAEKALRESEERYRELFENAKDAIYVHDLSGRYTSVNRAAERLSGFTREEILGKHFSNFVLPRDLKHVRTNLCRKLDEENETIYEVDMVRRDGQRVPVEVSSRLILENGVAVGVQGVARDITDRKRAQDALRTYSQRLIQAQEVEREKIARELHDEIGQVLTAVRINLQSIQRSYGTDESVTRLDESIGIVDEALGRVRELSIELRPALLDDLGLSVALRWYVDRYSQRTGITAEVLDGFEDDARLPREIETACFRIAQEALTNVARHAQAASVSVQLERSRERMLLTIMDDGVGFDIEALRKSASAASALGLRGMEERALAVGGYIDVDSGSGRGTRIRATFPFKRR
jgi:PAS domain S-box-containing protein